ncbi:hypothetical protein [Catenulispora yoronensis]
MRVRNLRRVSAVFAGTLGLAVSSLAIAATPASAQTVITCNGTGTVTWSPDLTSTVRSIDWSGQITYTGCHGIGLDGDHTYPVSMTSSGTETLSCNDLDGTGFSGSGTVTWSDGTTSHVTDTEISSDEINGEGSGEFNHTIEDGSHYVGADIVHVERDTSGGCPQSSQTFSLTLTLVAA